MAEPDSVELVASETPGARECAAAGCTNWFVPRSNRHAYCKGEGCTYKRGAPPADLEDPVGAAEELLRRLQRGEDSEAGPAQLVDRTRAVQQAMRAADAEAMFGALLDVAEVAVQWADRLRRGERPTAAVLQGVGEQRQRPVGLAVAVLASHRRCYALGEERVELLWRLLAAREELTSAELAVRQTRGTLADDKPRDAAVIAKRQVESVERALQSVEAAWRERGVALAELEASVATGTIVAAAARNGGGRV